MRHESNTTHLLRRGMLVVLLVGAMCVPAGVAHAQTSVGGHFGAVLPLVSRADGTTTTIADDFVIGFPTGITIKPAGRVAFDLELVPVIQNEPLNVALTVHPGVLVAVADRVTAGARIAFDVAQPSWGFTPLLNYRLSRVKSMAVFGELVVPIRFQQVRVGDTVTSIGLGVHIGVGF